LQYHQYMAGVDALDKMLSSYRPKMRSKNVVEFIFAFVEYGRSGRVSPANHHPFIAREAICKKPPGATVILTNNPPDIARTLPPIMCPRTMCTHEICNFCEKSSCIVMEISTQKWEAYLCILIRNVETLESNYSTTAGQISAKLCKTLSLIKAYV
ncbi:hypothetical protein T05_12454, partial [Trichinella murrelli]